MKLQAGVIWFVELLLGGCSLFSLVFLNHTLDCLVFIQMLKEIAAPLL